MNFGALYYAKLVAAAAADGAGTEVDLGKSFVEPGKRPIAATLTAINGVSSDSCTFDYKLQESNTTVDSDFADITGAAFTQFTDASTPGFETIYFNTTKRYVRGYGANLAGSVFVVGSLLLTKRDA